MAFSDLDALIGDIRREAARRRAAPDFPVDDEARMALEMDRQGPTGGVTDVAAVVDAIRAVAERGTAGGPCALTELADLSGSAVRALAVRLSDIERRVERLAPALPGPPGVGEAGGAGSGDDSGLLDHWVPVVSALSRAVGAGRVLVAGPGAARWAAQLASDGADVYGIDPAAPAFTDDGLVRSSGVAAHLQTVGEGALALAVLVGPLAAAELPHLGRWAAALAIRARTVLVVCEAPWAWRERLGDARSDTSAWRPASPETWMEVLDRAGYHLAGRYGPGGRDYCLGGSTGEPLEVPGP